MYLQIIDTSREYLEHDLRWLRPRRSVFKINTEPVPGPQLLKRLKEIYDPRPEKIIFVKGDPKVKYHEVIHAMDMARGAGVKVIGATPKDVK